MTETQPKVHTIDGKQYVDVERKAKEGELIIPVFDDRHYYPYFTEGGYYEVEYADRNGEVTVIDDGSSEHILSIGYYRVLEPTDSEEELVTASADNPDQIIELLGNLARRVTELEQRVSQSGEKFTAKQVAEIIKALGVGAND